MHVILYRRGRLDCSAPDLWQLTIDNIVDRLCGSSSTAVVGLFSLLRPGSGLHWRALDKISSSSSPSVSAVFLDINILQGSVTTNLKCGGIVNESLCCHFFTVGCITEIKFENLANAIILTIIQSSFMNRGIKIRTCLSQHLRLNRRVCALQIGLRVHSVGSRRVPCTGWPVTRDTHTAFVWLLIHLTFKLLNRN